jgi:hypothetical protein
MAPPTQLVITMIPNSVANSISVPISTALQSLEVAGQGSAADIAIRNIFKSHVFFDGKTTWFSSFQILSIVAQ